MTGAYHVGCEPFTVYGQNASPTVDGRPDVNHSENCGETCASMICEWVTGVQVYPSTIHDILFHNRDYVGPSDNIQLTSFLREVCNIPTRQIDVAPDPHALAKAEYDYLYWQCPLLILRFGDRPGWTQGEDLSKRMYHWCVVVGQDGVIDGTQIIPQVIRVADPWTGQSLQEDLATHYSWAAPASGDALLLAGVERLRAISLKAGPL